MELLWKDRGCVPIDVHVCFKKLYPRAEVDRKSSLAFYLKKCRLDGKADMPYNKMWRIYSEAKAGTSLRESHSSAMQNMHEVTYYCIIDALRCQKLMANGMKVQNLLGAYATKLDMLFSTRQSKNIEKGKYPGAYAFSPKKGIEIKRPVTGLDFVLLYPSLIMSYNLSPEKMILTYEEADNAQKNGNILHKIEAPSWCLNKVALLEDLFNKRVELKAQLASLGKKKECLGKMISSAKERAVCFEAGGITSMGQYNIGLVAKFVSGKGFRIKYGDTDSLYLTCPDKYYEICDRAFNEEKLSKEEYWTEIVNITMGVMKKLRDQVNAHLKIENGTSYLKMVYEEVLFPVCFTGKKKYFGIPHKGVVNFRLDELFRKEIDTVKKAKHKQWDFDDFIVMATWKPKKKNLCVHRFIGWMREKNERIPDPGERFSYVVVKGPPLYNEKGQKEPHRVGDYMEYADIAKKLNMEIDINYYLEKTVGLCARFINEDDRYQPPPSHKIMQLKDSDEKEKQIDTYSQDEAKKWLKKYIKGLQ
ncbi:hypothetical protein C1646_776218 [Rhizophagus diaphanus]|nr:hypothetical protein C1646_776218 [Rhizophagus diaphanus] [Rhizophagus sp. MUCL 43196]